MNNKQTNTLVLIKKESFQVLQFFPGELTVTELFCFVAGDAFSLSDVMWPAVSVSERRLGVFLISAVAHSQLGSDYISFSFAEGQGEEGRNTFAGSAKCTQELHLYSTHILYICCATTLPLCSNITAIAAPKSQSFIYFIFHCKILYFVGQLL